MHGLGRALSLFRLYLQEVRIGARGYHVSVLVSSITAQWLNPTNGSVQDLSDFKDYFIPVYKGRDLRAKVLE